jgi:hypothetical protein
MKITIYVYRRDNNLVLSLRLREAGQHAGVPSTRGQVFLKLHFPSLIHLYDVLLAEGHEQLYFSPLNNPNYITSCGNCIFKPL